MLRKGKDMRFDILTLFPNLFSGFLEESILHRAIEAGLIEVCLHNIRDYAPGKHHVTDDTPYGGGGGMVMKVEPIAYALEAIVEPALLARQKATGVVEIPIILLTPAGQRFEQAMAKRWERYGRLILICGRYEGVDQRVSDLFATEEVSLGDFVLSGGEVAAMAIVEAVSRLVPGVLGDMRAIVEDSFSQGLLEWPQYTRPPEFRGHRVPEILLSGDHARIAKWRREQALIRTWQRRPDLLRKATLTLEDLELLAKLESEQGDEQSP